MTLCQGAPSYELVPGFSVPEGQIIRTAVYSEDGSLFAYSEPSCVRIFEAESGKEKTVLDIPNVVEIGFSPRGSYLLTWHRSIKDEASGNFLPNLTVWNVSQGEKLDAYLQMSQGSWSLQYTYDEKFCARQISKNLIHFYESGNMKTPYAKLQSPDVTIGEFLLSPGQNYSVSVFFPEQKGRPASVRVYQIPNFQSPVSQKTFFKADRVKMKWNKLGTALLALASTDVDQSGKSYYGETSLYLLGIAGSYDSRIHLDREGAVHDFEWSPNSREFGVVYGFMPAKTTIFDSRGNEIYSFPLAPRNTLNFSPHARFLLVAGFGNLQGTIDIYDRQKQFAKVSMIEAANTSVCEWSPDGRYLLLATTSPRMRVDNGIRIWHISGKLVYAKDHVELLSASWRPQSVDLFPLRSSLSPAPEPHSSVSQIKTKTVVSSKPAGAYRPPHARTSGISAAPTPLYQRVADKNAGGVPGATGRYVPGAGNRTVPGAKTVPGAGARTIPGAGSAIPGASKPKKKKNTANNTGSSPAPEKTKVEEKPAKADKKPSPPKPATTSNNNNKTAKPEESALAPEERKVRALLKKLRAVEDLKRRQASGDKLEALQVQKIATEESLRQELAALNWNDDK